MKVLDGDVVMGRVGGNRQKEKTLKTESREERMEMKIT